MELLKKIKELQADMMASTELPHVVSVRLLARLDEAERHLGSKGISAALVSTNAKEVLPNMEKLESVKNIEDAES